MNIERYQQKFPGISSSFVYLNRWQKDRLLEKEGIKNNENEFQFKNEQENHPRKMLSENWFVVVIFNQVIKKTSFNA